MQAQPGHFYAVGIGPGSPDLLTVRAVKILESVDIILTPQAKGTNRSLHSMPSNPTSKIKR